jgi:hypothetical protein
LFATLINILLLLALLGLAFYGIRRYVLAAPDRKSQRYRHNLMLIGGGVFLLLLVMGRFGVLVPLLGAGLAILVRLAPVMLQLLLQQGVGWNRGRERPLGEDETEENTREQRQRHDSRSGMSEVEAREVLGLQAGCSRQDIVNAHRRLIQKLHPDRGGSDYLAAKINQAKDILLRRCG